MKVDSNRKSLLKPAKTTCRNLLAIVEEAIGIDYMHWPDGGFHNGSPDTPVRGVVVTWLANVAALAEASRRGCNVVLCHETVFPAAKHELPPYRWLTPVPETSDAAWHPTRKKWRLIERRNLTIVQCHYGLDRYCIFKTVSEALGLTALRYDHGWESVFELPRTFTLRALVAQVKTRLKIKGTVRVVGDPGRRVRRVINLWGGMGLNANLYWLEQGIRNGADAAICGEMDEVFMRFVADAGLAAIETSHQLSEEIGMSHYAEQLRRRFPDLRVVTFLQGRPYQTL